MCGELLISPEMFRNGACAVPALPTDEQSAIKKFSCEAKSIWGAGGSASASADIENER